MLARTRRHLGWSLLALASLLAGCKLGPEFKPPAEAAPTSWKAAQPAEEARALPERWWTLFADPALDQLVERALLHNQELDAGLARVEQARALAGLARAAQSPTLSIDPSLQRQQLSGNRQAPPGTNHASYTSTSIELPLDVAYEVDLWGRLRRVREAADAAARASAYDYATLSLAISSEVARTYFAAGSARHEEEILRQGVELRQRALALVEGRARAGIGDELDSSRARAELARVEAEQHALARARAGLENALAVLCGEAPADLAPVANSEPATLPSVPAGLPSELLRKRPDLAAALERLHEASARIGVSEAEAYPRLSLTGSLGFVSTQFAKLFDAASRAWTLGAGLSAPIYEGGASDERARAARAFYEERAADCRATLLVAFREVEDALSALAELGAESRFQQQAQTAAQTTLALADARYRQGLVGYLDVVDAARVELDSRRATVQIERLRAESTVLLIQALGGGWSAESQSAK